MSIDFTLMTSEQTFLLMGLGLPAMVEMRLLELDGREALFSQLGMPTVPGCNLLLSSSVLPSALYGGAVAEYLIYRGLAERVHDPEKCPHLRLTKWGREFTLGSFANIMTVGRR